MNGSLRRSRMVSFRLSPEEYEQLQSVCATQGARSLSELARAAMQRMISPGRGAKPLEHEVGDIRNQVRHLSDQVNRLSEVVESLQPR